MNGRFIDLLWLCLLNSPAEDNKSFIFYPTQVPSCLLGNLSAYFNVMKIASVFSQNMSFFSHLDMQFACGYVEQMR